MTVGQLKDFIDRLEHEILTADVNFKDEDDTNFTVDLAEVTIDSNGKVFFFLR